MPTSPASRSPVGNGADESSGRLHPYARARRFERAPTGKWRLDFGDEDARTVVAGTVGRLRADGSERPRGGANFEASVGATEKPTPLRLRVRRPRAGAAKRAPARRARAGSAGGSQARDLPARGGPAVQPSGRDDVGRDTPTRSLHPRSLDKSNPRRPWSAPPARGERGLFHGEPLPPPPWHLRGSAPERVLDFERSQAAAACSPGTYSTVPASQPSACSPDRPHAREQSPREPGSPAVVDAQELVPDSCPTPMDDSVPEQSGDGEAEARAGVMVPETCPMDSEEFDEVVQQTQAIVPLGQADAGENVMVPETSIADADDDEDQTATRTPAVKSPPVMVPETCLRDADEEGAASDESKAVLVSETYPPDNDDIQPLSRTPACKGVSVMVLKTCPRDTDDNDESATLDPKPTIMVPETCPADLDEVPKRSRYPEPALQRSVTGKSGPVLVPETCPLDADEAPPSGRKPPSQPTGKALQVLVPDTPDQSLAMTQSQTRQSPLARNLFDAMDGPGPDLSPRPPTSASRGTPSSRATSSRTVSGSPGGEQQVTVIAGGAVDRMRQQLGMSPGSVEPHQSLALDPAAASRAWALLAQTCGADSSSASLPASAAAAVSDSPAGPGTASSSEVCPNTPRKKPALSRLSLGEGPGFSPDSAGPSGAPASAGSPTVLSRGALARGEANADCTPRAFKGEVSAAKGSNTGRSSIGGPANSDVKRPRRFRVTPVPLVLPDELCDEPLNLEVPPKTNEVLPAAGEVEKADAVATNLAKDVDVEMADEKAEENRFDAEADMGNTTPHPLKRSLFQTTRKPPTGVDPPPGFDPTLMVSAFKTAKDGALTVSRKRLENAQLQHVTTVDDPSACAGKSAKRPRESIDSMILNENGPNTPFLQKRPRHLPLAFTTGRGAIVPPPNAARLKEAKGLLDGAQVPAAPTAFPIVFTNGKGAQLQTPTAKEIEKAKAKLHGAPQAPTAFPMVFTNGKGAQLRTPTAKEIEKAKAKLGGPSARLPLHSRSGVRKPRESLESILPQEAFGGFRTPRPVGMPPGGMSLMFETAGGKKLAPPSDKALNAAKQRLEGGEVKRPLFSDLKENTPANAGGKPLFETASGRAVKLSTGRPPLARVLPFNQVTSPRDGPVSKLETPGAPVELDSTKKVTFDTAVGDSMSKTPGTGLTTKSTNRRLLLKTPPVKASGFPKTTNARAANSGIGRSTPYRRPRKVLSAQKSLEKNVVPKVRQTNEVDVFFPKGSVPRLSTSGRLVGSVDGMDIDISAPVTALPVTVSCPAQGMGIVLSKEHFGEWELLPYKLKALLKFAEIPHFNVDNCESLLTHVFPAAENKAATRIGSRAWTRMSYGLAAWKLSRLDRDAEATGNAAARFLTAANLVREIWRRVDREWHSNRAPHLSQMLRRDMSPRSHVVLIVTSIAEAPQNSLILEVSDGWYICRLKPCDLLTSKIRRGFLRVGVKIHLSDCELLSVSNAAAFFFGDGDELASSVLVPKANCVKRVRPSLNSTAVLGMRAAPLFVRSLAGLTPAGGPVPGAQVAVVRSYPPFFIESTTRAGEKSSVFRRREAEEAAQADFEKEMEARMEARGPGEREEVLPRAVSSVVDVTVTGIRDDPGNEITVRIYRPGEETIRAIAEGSVVQLPSLKPGVKAWTSMSAAVRPVPLQPGFAIPSRPRTAWTCRDLLKETLPTGSDFDGVYTVLHLTPKSATSSQRFAFLLDDLDYFTPIALELSSADADHPPPAISRVLKEGQYPLIALRDATKTGVDVARGIVHATASLRTEILSAASLRRRRGAGFVYLQGRLNDVASARGGDGCKFPLAVAAKLDVNAEAVASFVSGRRGSIGAYFSNTQDSPVM